jgi:hypothetical protein
MTSHTLRVFYISIKQYHISYHNSKGFSPWRELMDGVLYCILIHSFKTAIVYTFSATIFLFKKLLSFGFFIEKLPQKGEYYGTKIIDKH